VKTKLKTELRTGKGKIAKGGKASENTKKGRATEWKKSLDMDEKKPADQKTVAVEGTTQGEETAESAEGQEKSTTSQFSPESSTPVTPLPEGGRATFQSSDHENWPDHDEVEPQFQTVWDVIAPSLHSVSSTLVFLDIR
jgi:hypothetical protein